MTFRESLADWISGGKLRRARQVAIEAHDLWASAIQARDMANFELKGVQDIAADLVIALREIAAMETPKANATVKRMAKTAREAMK